MWSARRFRHPLVLASHRCARAIALAFLVWASGNAVGIPAQAADCDEPARRPVAAADLAAKLNAGEPVFLNCVRVVGRIELQAGAAEVGPFFLIESTLEGGISAPFARFAGPVHFDGSCFEGDLDLAGAVFEDEVNWARTSFDCGPRPARVSAPASRFHAPADLRAGGYAAVDFTDASFAARTLFQGTDFEGDATFRGALFEDQTSFRGAVFAAYANFENVTALGDVDLSSTQFLSDALFRRFSSSGRLSLRDAGFGRDFNIDRASASSIDLARATFRGSVHMSDLSAVSLQMTPSVVGRIEDRQAQINVLRTIERSAKAQNDTGLANLALFQRQSLATRERSQPGRTIWLGVELVTGYLVRPVRPLTAMAAVALIGLAVRLAIDGRSVAAALRRSLGLRPMRTTLVEPRDPGARRRSSWHIVALLAAPAGRALNAAINPKPPQPEIEETDGSTYAIATLIWLEYLVQKLLIVVFLISLGNANPTIREIITSVL